MGDSFTVQITTKLVNRLAEDGDKLKKRTKKTKPKVHKKPQETQATKVDHHKPPSDWPIHAPMLLPVSPSPAQVSNAELDAIRSVLQESEKVVDKLQKHQENMAQEVTLKAKQLHDKEFKLPYQKPFPCLAERNACLECYKEYAKDSLKCASVVKTFADCARKARQLASSLS
ncbi:hypothetical protein IFM89_034302 [Coptis chinensis]|uniref:Uncharacterized protein n=1 Tax=Coptis chinensis TaxID=261450 RepID=A0A835IG94_9MAGN|nr:hypothetical protein IFM89_034302 [Coptis chinensis]